MYEMPVVDAQFAARVMGYHSAIEACSALRAEAAPSLARPNGSYVSQKSLLLYLRRHLPPWVSVDSWIEDCQATAEPLMDMRGAGKLLAIPHCDIRHVLEGKRARYIVRRDPDGSIVFMVSHFWVQTQIESDEPLRSGQVAVLLGVTPRIVRIWKKSGQQICPISFHEHNKGEEFLWRACWVAYLSSSCASTLAPEIETFVRRQLTTERQEVLSTSQFAHLYGYSRRRVGRLIKSGHLPIIRTPGGGYRTTVEWAECAGIQPKR